MEQNALPLASRSQPPPPSTLAPPPLETAITGTRALQRFDLGRMRASAAASTATSSPSEEIATPEIANDEIAMPEISKEENAQEEIAITVATMKIAVPAKIKQLPPSDTAGGTAPWPRFDLQAAARWTKWKSPARWTVPRPTLSAPQPFAILRDAAWALAATASLALAGSVASALVYAIAFP